MLHFISNNSHNLQSNWEQQNFVFARLSPFCRQNHNLQMTLTSWAIEHLSCSHTSKSNTKSWAKTQTLCFENTAKTSLPSICWFSNSVTVIPIWVSWWFVNFCHSAFQLMGFQCNENLSNATTCLSIQLSFSDLKVENDEKWNLADPFVLCIATTGMGRNLTVRAQLGGWLWLVDRNFVSGSFSFVVRPFWEEPKAFVFVVDKIHSQQLCPSSRSQRNKVRQIENWIFQWWKSLQLKKMTLSHQ